MKWKISAKRDMCAKSLQSCPTRCDPMDPAPVSTGLSRQEHCSGSPCPPPGDLPDPGTNLRPSVSCRAGRLVTTSATWRPRHVSTLESCFFLAVQGLRSRTALTRNQAHALRWKPWVWTTRPPGKSTGEDPPRWAWPWFQASAWPRGPGWGTDLLESGVPRARWASCPTLCPAEPGARRKAHSGVGYLSSSYLILPAPVLQVLPSAHPEHRRKKELWS